MSDVQIESVISTCLAVLSVISATYIAFSARKAETFIDLESSRLHGKSLWDLKFLVQSIKWMAICDIIFEFLLAWMYSSVTISVLASIDATWQCTVKAIFLQYFSVASISWNFIIAIILLRVMIFGTSLAKFSNEIRCYHFYVWYVLHLSLYIIYIIIVLSEYKFIFKYRGIALLMSAIPLCGNVYGYTRTYDGDNYECWISNELWQLCLFGPAIIYLLFSFCLLIYTIYVRIYNRVPNLSMKLIYYTLVFVLLWTFPIIDRMSIIIHDYQEHTYDYTNTEAIYVKNKTVFTRLFWVHNMCLASVGLGWYMIFPNFLSNLNLDFFVFYTY